MELLDVHIWGRIPIEIWFIIKEKLMESLRKPKRLKPGVILYYDNRPTYTWKSDSYFCRVCKRNMNAFSHYCLFCDKKLGAKSYLSVRKSCERIGWDTLCIFCKTNCTNTYDRCRHLEIYFNAKSSGLKN